MKYLGEPSSDNKKAERVIWSLNERAAIGKAIIVISLLIVGIGWFILHLQPLFIVAIVFIASLATVFVMKDAHNKAFDEYWSYWQEQKKKR